MHDLADAVLVFVILRSRSASRTFCTITCLAFCAAMRPNSIGGRVSAMMSPIGRRRIAALRFGEADLGRLVLDLLDDEQQRG